MALRPYHTISRNCRTSLHLRRPLLSLSSLQVSPSTHFQAYFRVAPHFAQSRTFSNYTTQSMPETNFSSKIKLNYKVASDSSESKDIKDIQNSKKFKEWYSEMCQSYGEDAIEKIEVEYIKRFSSGDIGFIVLDASIKYKGKRVPGVVFVRGQSCAILIVLKCEGRKYALLTKQPRVPVGRDILEIAAGTVDEGEVSGTAVREIEEETGLKIQEKDLVQLSSEPVYPSPGGMDEQMTLYLYEKEITKEELKKLDRVETGLRDHGEMIELCVLPLSEVHAKVRDMKSLLSLHIYEQREREKSGGQ